MGTVGTREGQLSSVTLVVLVCSDQSGGIWVPCGISSTGRIPAFVGSPWPRVLEVMKAVAEFVTLVGSLVTSCRTTTVSLQDS